MLMAGALDAQADAPLAGKVQPEQSGVVNVPFALLDVGPVGPFGPPPSPPPPDEPPLQFEPMQNVGPESPLPLTSLFVPHPAAAATARAMTAALPIIRCMA